MGDVLKVAALVVLALVVLQLFRNNTGIGGKVFVTASTWKANNGT